MTVSKEDWDRKLSYSLTTTNPLVEARCLILTEVLVSLHELGWSPLAPLATSQHHHTAVCFKRRDSARRDREMSSSNLSLSDLTISTSSFCLQRYGEYLVMRGVTNTLLYTLVTSLHDTRDIAGVRNISISENNFIITSSKYRGKGKVELLYTPSVR